MTGTETAQTHECDRDVVVVGGGPSGCSVGLFTARYGLDTVVFDRGRSSIQRCAHLENYPGFPAGVDVETFYGLLYDHAAEAGCELVDDHVESVTRVDGGRGFLIAPQTGSPVTARRVVAATRYDGAHMRPLGDEVPFETHEHESEADERFDRSSPDEDGTTPIEGLYVASPSTAADRQAIVAAGRGARVGLTLVGAVRREAGYPRDVADRYDWVRREATLDDAWSDRDRWREWFDEALPSDHGLDEDRRIELREREIDRLFETYIPTESVERRAEEGHERLLEHLDDDAVLARAREIESERESLDPVTDHGE